MGARAPFTSAKGFPCSAAPKRRHPLSQSSCIQSRARSAARQRTNLRLAPGTKNRGKHARSPGLSHWTAAALASAFCRKSTWMTVTGPALWNTFHQHWASVGNVRRLHTIKTELKIERRWGQQAKAPTFKGRASNISEAQIKPATLFVWRAQPLIASCTGGALAAELPGVERFDQELLELRLVKRADR